MTGNRQAQRAFDAGVLSLGITIDGQESTRDLEYAKLAFTTGNRMGSEMCDAWLGRAAAGEITPRGGFQPLQEQSSTSLFREQRRLGLRRANSRAGS